jgi:hypothetical protein
VKNVYIILIISICSKFGFGVTKQNSNYLEIIAKSSDIHIINSNDLKNHLANIDERFMNDYYYYSVEVLETIKGIKVNNIKYRLYLEQGMVDYIKLLPDNAKLIVFITNLYSRFRNTGVDEFNNYITKHRNSYGIIVYNQKIYKEITGEVAKQQLILHERSYESFVRDEIMDHKIKRLIGELIIEQKETAAFEELRMMGRDAVPYIILYMDDYRELPIKNIQLENNCLDAWEDTIYYRPELVIDMLGLILNELTKSNFGQTWADGTNEERQRSLDGWRIYLYYTYPMSTS